MGLVSWWRQMSALGLILAFGALLLHRDFLPEKAHFGHWFWVSFVGLLLTVAGWAGQRVEAAQQRRNG
jgi:hypothetical protein